MILFAAHLLIGRHAKLGAVDVENHATTTIHLVHVRMNDLADAILVLLVHRVLLDLADLVHQRLLQVGDGAAPEGAVVDDLDVLIAHFQFRIQLLCAGEFHLEVLALDLAVGHDLPLTIDLDVALIQVEGDVERILRVVLLLQHGDEGRLHHFLEILTIDALALQQVDHGIYNGVSLVLLGSLHRAHSSSTTTAVRSGYL